MINICSSGSSGSTLLAQLLDNHPEIVCGEELGLFSKPIVYRNYARLKRTICLVRKFGISSTPYFEDRSILRNLASYGLTEKTVWGWVRGSSSIGDLAAKIMEYVLQTTRKKIWAEKTPENIMLIGDFISAFPDAKVIHIVRDPRDVVLSLMKRGLSVLTAAETWLVSVSCIQSYKNRSDVLEIKYEDLVSNTENTLKIVADFLRVKYDAGYFRNDTFASEHIKRSSGFQSWTLVPSGKISGHAMGKYKNTEIDLSGMFSVQLSSEFANFIGTEQFSLVDLAARYGYDFSGISKAVCMNRAVVTLSQCGPAMKLLYSYIDIGRNMVRAVY